jgi:hypothetical protein
MADESRRLRNPDPSGPGGQGPGVHDAGLDPSRELRLLANSDLCQRGASFGRRLKRRALLQPDHERDQLPQEESRDS